MSVTPPIGAAQLTLTGVLLQEGGGDLHLDSGAGGSLLRARDQRPVNWGTGAPTTSCAGHCGSTTLVYPGICYCDPECTGAADCCSGYNAICN